MPISLPPLGALVTLRSGDTELVVAPECGARLVAFRVGGRDVLRPASAETLDAKAPPPYGFAAFPLMPYSGPIFGDGCQFDGTWFPLGRNVPAEPTATHGEGWIRPWRTEERSAKAVVLSFEHQPAANAFPFRWRGDIRYAVSDGQLTAELRLTNIGRRAMPAGLGLHPYFPNAPGTILRFDASGVWPPDTPEAVKLGVGPLEPGLDFRAGQEVDGIVLDRCFESWDGDATLTAPDGFVTRITAEPVFAKLQIYDPWGYPYICIEPVTNANDGFNRAALGVPGHAVVTLEPGESLGGRITIGAAPP